MLEISPEISFLHDSRLQFLLWDRSPRSLDTWDWSQGIYCFVQFRPQSLYSEMRFGAPLWGIPSNISYIEYPFVPTKDLHSYKKIEKVWSQTLSKETVIVLCPQEDEQRIRFEFAKLSLSSLPNLAWEEAAKNFGLIGELYLQLEETAKQWKKTTLFPSEVFESLPPIRLVGGIKKEAILQSVRPREVELQVQPVNTLPSTPMEIHEAPLDSRENAPAVALEVSSPEEEKEKTEAIAAKETEPAQEPEKQEVKEESKSTQVDASSEPQEVGNTKFSIQLKMMGVISILFILTVSAIIFFASNFFRKSTELQLRDNNLRIAEIVGSKVASDVLNAAERGKQIAVTLTTIGIPEDQKRKLIDSYFLADKEFIYLGIYEKQGDALSLKKEVFNEEELKLSSVTEEDFHNVVKRNQDAFSEAFTGQPVLLNTSPGFSEPSFSLAIPTEENGRLDNILIMIIKLQKIIGAFEKKGIETTFFVNGSGMVIAHPKEDLVLSASNLSQMPIVKTMLTSAAPTGQSSYLDQDTKTSFLGSFKKIGFADTGVITIVSEDKAFEAVYDIQKKNLYIMAIGLCAALVFVFLFSKTITKPILQLLTATLQIARGNFRIGIKPTTKDEVGLLTEYFIEMGKGLEEREKVKNILGSMIDPVVVKEAMIDLAALKRGSETMITAFFSDVAGFSTISEQLKSQDLAALLNEYLSAMTIILKQHEGVLDKYIGDAIVGIFSAPVVVEEHQLKAARASVDMIEKLKDLRAYWKANQLYTREAQEMDCRIGLNSGPAKVGFMGTDALASYTMMGDTVNLAARLEAAGKDYGVNILITDSVQAKLQDEMVTRYLDLVRVKGKNEPVRIHELIGYRSNISESLLQSARLYEEGFQSYLDRDWNKAIAYFEESERAKGMKDKACHVLIERCEEYKISKPDESWDGVFTRTHK
ncbi:adenylate/guanylate cyclase catalytic domain protein [Leptospira ryugenii]|uniref:Adenylate/guanylate cyclase catalytic domain protein n=1 Tax=Leptospira ryugenii TaxID=1917863 RepID=A0A2P2DX85_9LEPT|nr:adenylate/guanylate cyclase domain-containing protein [Leptospira ryugenii]GBF49216.1 adenylate/guanylate cyclase catalytic domain protein [Leptospira ryugenii]